MSDRHTTLSGTDSLKAYRTVTVAIPEPNADGSCSEDCPLKCYTCRMNWDRLRRDGDAVPHHHCCPWHEEKNHDKDV